MVGTQRQKRERGINFSKKRKEFSGKRRKARFLPKKVRCRSQSEKMLTFFRQKKKKRSENVSGKDS